MRVAIVLAAGASRRMGRPKLELDLGGTTVLERSVHNLSRASIDRVRVVVAPDATFAASEAVELVVNSDRDSGLASSLKAGLRDLPAGTKVVLVALADKPFVLPETIRKLLDVFDGGDAKVVYPVYRGEQGHPVLWDSTLVDELLEVDGDRGAKAVLDAHRVEAVAVDVEDPGVCVDIDTPDDYRAALERL